MKRLLILLFGILVGLPALCQIAVLQTDSVKLILADFDYPTQTLRLNANQEKVRSVPKGVEFIPQLIILPESENGFVIKTIAIPVPLPLDSTIVENDLMTYAGTWNHFVNTTTNWSSNNASVSSQTGATATYQCQACRKISWYTERYPTHGKVAIRINDGAEQIVDLYNATRQSKQRVFTTPLMAKGNHRITLRATGTKNPLSSGTVGAINDFVIVTKDK